MADSKPSPGDQPSPWVSPNEPVIKPADEPETYPIPGGITGWSPADLPPVATVVHKSPPREEPKPRGPRIGGKRIVKSDWLALAGFNLLVFLSSICVMTLELTASRLIAKHVGSSLYTWTSVIGVVLAGITIGNYLGGWLADRFDRARTLAWMYLLGSFSCTSVLWLDQVVTGFTRPQALSWPMWILCVVALIFLFPALTLGTTSPLVASMALARSTKTGMTVGNVYAWGAFGSIVGTFLTGFYLIDLWGTRAIVGLTAGVLAVLAIAVAGGRWAFRSAVMFGWLQLLTWCVLAATMTKSAGERGGAWIGEIWGWRSDEVKASITKNDWRLFGGNVAGKLHDLGILLKLRDDQPGYYHDESSYSYIHVGDDYTDGSQVRYLRLDKLIHSYYEPDNPTALHYEYEQVYAAVTKAVAPGPSGPVTVTVPEFPGDEELLAKLPSGVTFDAASRTLKVQSLTGTLVDELRNLSQDAPYWNAIEKLHQETNVNNWGGFSTVALEQLPNGLAIPPDLFHIVRYDAALQVLSGYGVLTPELRERLANLSPQAPWRRATQALRLQSGPISTLFLGGGGFVFPRWIAAEFPGATRIDVAELDPAVHRVVQLELGLSPHDEQRIHTTIGDARNFVEDRFNDNQRLKAAGQPPVLYDFVYGDAFNDFSVPFHLATMEFDAMVQALLTPTGVFQQNIIDIYPRTEAPGGEVGEATVDLSGDVPPAALANPGAKRPQIHRKFAPLELIPSTPDTPQRLHTTVPISYDRESELLRLANDATDNRNGNENRYISWEAAIRELAEASRQKRLVPTTLPEALAPRSDLEHDWTPCPEPFAGVETYRVGQNGYVLGFRGAVSDALRKRLIDLKPDDPNWVKTIHDGVKRSREAKPGRFLARYVQTVAKVFPCIYVFSTSHSQPGDDRDTFVVVCSQRPLDLDHVEDTGLWTGKPFAAMETLPGSNTPALIGQMDSLLEHSGRIALTDDYAPVDNLLKPVFALQD